MFPAGRICRDPRFGAPSRYHLHEFVVQKALADATRRAGITKRVCAVSRFRLGDEKIQEHARAHDANAVVLFQIEQV